VRTVPWYVTSIGDLRPGNPALGGARQGRAVRRPHVIWLLATAFISLGLVNLDSRADGGGTGRRLALGVPLVGIYTYVAMPPLVFPQAFALLLLTLVPNAFLTAARRRERMVASRRIVSLRRTPLWPRSSPSAWSGSSR